jgi:hypothetical protein
MTRFHTTALLVSPCVGIGMIVRINIDRIGIHGRPYRTWGDVPGIERKIGTASYCPHSNALFLGWHRPYLALFEVVFVVGKIFVTC